jgi:site-specific recombinase XerD
VLSSAISTSAVTCSTERPGPLAWTGLTPHELRHTAASLAVSAGASVKSVQRMLGHASAAMTLDVFSGLFEDDLDAVADRLDAARPMLVCSQCVPSRP